jgi:hypothetical protein
MLASYLAGDMQVGDDFCTMGWDCDRTSWVEPHLAGPGHFHTLREIDEREMIEERGQDERKPWKQSDKQRTDFTVYFNFEN